MNINWLKYKKFYFAFSAIMLIVSITSLVVNGLIPSVEFTGGSLLEYSTDSELNASSVESILDELNISHSSVQNTSEGTLFIKTEFIQEDAATELENNINNKLGVTVDRLRFESVGPSVGQELIKKTLFAIALSSLAILLWVAYQFKNITYGISAILAMLHDTIILIGAFSILGYFYGVAVDFLFVTAVLTTLSFSVHDTIVVFDRIRELAPDEDTLEETANTALTQTMVRSLNNSFTIIFMLLALILLGGTTIKWFAVALMIGTILGTYSSPFVAVPLLTTLSKYIKRK